MFSRDLQLAFMARQIFIGLSLLILASCASAPDQRNTVKEIYDRAAQYHTPDRNPVIVIPGILGSRLVDNETGKTVWGAFSGEYANPNTAEGVRLITLPIAPEAVVAPDQVVPDGVLESLKLKVAGFPLQIAAYKGILTTLGAGGYRDQSLGLNSIDYGTDHYTCFQFDYDWRRDISYNAERLKNFIEARRREVQRQYEIEYGIKDHPVKFDIVAHSMGALLTRYYLRYGGEELPNDGHVPPVNWAGADDIERAVLVAPPNAGSLDAFEQLVKGFHKGGPFLPAYEPAVLGSFPSVYQLLPRPRHGQIVMNGDLETPITDIYDADLWRKNGWGLSSQGEANQKILSQLLPEVSSASERNRLAFDYQKRALARAKQFHEAIDKPAEAPRGLDLFLVAGDAVETAQYSSFDAESEKISVLKHAAGDEVVLRSSALLDERIGAEWTPRLQSPIDWTSVLFLPGKHRDLTSNSVFEDNVLYWLLEEPR